jgi:hypothetical protein
MVLDRYAVRVICAPKRTDPKACSKRLRRWVADIYQILQTIRGPSPKRVQGFGGHVGHRSRESGSSAQAGGAQNWRR